MRNRLTLLFIILISFFIVSQIALCKENNYSPFGYWEGIIELPGMNLEIQLNFEKNEQGEIIGNISIPVQNAKNLPLSDIESKEKKITFKITGIPGEPIFEGTFIDKKKITGDFTQNEKTFPFTLTKKQSPELLAKKSLSKLDDIIKKALESFNLPGVSISIVKGNEIIYSKGFGYRNLEDKLPMTPDTLMAIGSTTKAFTTFVLGTMVDNGLVEWDGPVDNYIPWFKMNDPMVSQRIMLRDLITHCSGLPRHDLTWYNNKKATREDLVRKIAHLKLNKDLREEFQYNNLMFLTAGYLIEKVTGKSWEENVKQRIFDPLNMERTNFSVLESQKDSNYALPYRENKQKIEKIPFRNITTVGPAGSINSSTKELANWMIVHLNNGKFKDKKIISSSSLDYIHTPYIVTGRSSTKPEISSSDYGLGWFIDTYRSHKRVSHGGNIDGFSALITLFPGKNLGIAVLTNKNGTPIPGILTNHASDLVFELEPIDWIGEAKKKREQGLKAQNKAEQKKTTRKKKGTKPSHPLEDYKGTYEHPGYGKLEVVLKEGNLSLIYNNIQTPLEHWHYDVFNGEDTKDKTFKDMKFHFINDFDGNITKLEAPFEPAVDNIVFYKKPNKKLFDPEYLSKLTGEYDLIGTEVNITLKGNSLMLNIPGQPQEELVPDIGGEFYLKSVKIVKIKFVEDKSGKITSFELIQPGGIYTAEKKE